MSRVRCDQRVWLMNIFLNSFVVKNHDFSWIWKTLLVPEKHLKTHTSTSGKTPVLRERSYHMTRGAVVSRVIRVQRRYAVRIWPIQSVGLVNFGQIFELFIELYIICTHFSYIEYLFRIHLVKISLIFIKYEPSTERSKGLAHARFFFGPIRGEKSWFFMNLNNLPGTSETLEHAYPDL